MVGGLRAIGVLGVFVFKTPKLRVLYSARYTDAGRSNKYYHWPIGTESLQLYS